MTYIPADRRSYKGSITDTDRWQEFQNEPGDVLVCTPPKCGTTWTTTIVTMLTQGSTDVSLLDRVQWVDANVVPVDEMTASLEAQSHSRCIKTHTPFDGIPWYPDAAYIAVYRHPLDMLFSLRKHLSNAKTCPPDHPYLRSEDESVRDFISHGIDPTDFDFDSLETLINHYKSYAETPRPDNLLLLHYADMLADARGAIIRIADHIRVDAKPAFIDAVHQASSFDKMKAQADRFAPFSAQDYWQDPQAFFDSAGTKKWAGKLSAATLSMYRKKIAKLLNPTETAWLENGSRN